MPTGVKNFVALLNVEFFGNNKVKSTYLNFNRIFTEFSLEAERTMTDSLNVCLTAQGTQGTGTLVLATYRLAVFFHS